MSLEVEKRLAQKMEPPYLDPYGNPIPGLDALGIEESQATAAGKDPSNPTRELSEAIADGESRQVRLERIGERVQSDVALLGELARHGIFHGVTMGVERVADSFVLRGPAGGEVSLSDAMADQLHVTELRAGKGSVKLSPGPSCHPDPRGCPATMVEGVPRREEPWHSPRESPTRTGSGCERPLTARGQCPGLGAATCRRLRTTLTAALCAR